MSKTRDRTEARYWERRLYRNTYTYEGRSRQVSGWCVKIQWEGSRRTVRLHAGGREAAAREALRLYDALRRGGWPALERSRGGWENAVTGGQGGLGVARVLRVAPRKYVSDLNPGFSQELFAELAADGATDRFALGTEEANEGHLRAMELESELRRDGRAQLRLAHSREATVAVFWHANPMTCTYTTLLTFPPQAGVRAPPGSSRGWRVLVIESDGGVRRALAHWLARCRGITRVDGCPQASEVTAEEGRWDLILANREQPPLALRALLAGPPSTPVRLLTHGVFSDSDEIFASFSGVSQGYLLRRVAPAMLLSPLVLAFEEGPPRRVEEGDRQVRKYFQAIFETDGEQQTGLRMPEVTTREREILDLLGRGFADKEIAGELGISIWTVHSHLKRIFAKYAVRTRTEAVVRHLQK